MPKSTALRLYVILATLFISSFSYAQKTITGVVRDSKGPVVGSTISVKGTTAVTLSGNDGSFTITLPKGRSSIIVSSVGFASKEVKVPDNQTTLNVDLTVTNTGLDEVFVTGYTAQKKRDLTGAVSIVKTGDLTKVASASFAQQLAGRATGVTVSTTGAAGDGASVRIRGISTFGGGDPLVVIDGVQTSGQFFNDINSNDIESIQVLKDAATTAAYGIGGTNGVIIVTTKKGKSGQPKVEYTGYYGSQTAVNGYDKFMIKTSQEYADLVYQSNNNAGLWPLAATTNIAKTYGTNPGRAVLPVYLTPLGGTPSSPYVYSTDPGLKNLITKANQQGTNWWDVVMQTAPITEQNVSASGGSDKGKYFFSFNYYNQQGTMRYTDFKRYTVRANTEFKVKAFTFGESMQVGFSNSVGQPNGGNSEQNILVSGILKQQPIIPVYDEGGNFAGSKNFGNGRNGLAELYRNKDNRGEFFKLIGNVYSEIRFLNHFTAKVNFGMNYGINFFQGFTFVDPEADEPRGSNSFGESTQRYNGWVINEQVDYNNQIGEHNFKLTALHEAKLNLGRTIGGGLSNYFLESRDLRYLNTALADPATRTVGSGGNKGPAKESYMGRVEYNYKSKYLLNATFRYDQSSTFPEEKGKPFYGVGVAWNVSQERFMQQVKFVNNLKLRVAYGETGNDNIDGSAGYSFFGGGTGTTFYDINGTNTSIATGYTATSFGNRRVRWETQTQQNIGLDASLLNNHLDVSIDAYNRGNRDFLFRRGYPGTFPVLITGTPFENLGNISNKGFEFSATWKNKVGKDFDYSVGVNLTSNKNKIEELAPEFGLTSFFAGVETRIGPLVRHEQGKPMSTFYGYTVDGIFQNAAEVAASNQLGAAVGRFRWKDINGDKKIDDKDKGAIGDPNAKLVFGINLTAAYKGFDVSMFLTGTQGNKIFNYTRYFTDFFGFNGNRSQRMLYDSWTPTRTNAKLPLLDVTDTYSFVPSTYYVEDGSYLRCKVLQIGYKIPADILKRVKIDNMRFYVQAQNLFTITKYGGLDPELGTRNQGNSPDPYSGVDGGNYPNSRLISVGLNLGF
jgi:TonB-dependent starch-binding outer membrane protein SusC